MSGPGTGVVIRDNILLDGDHAALRVDDRLSDVVLVGNVVTGFAGASLILAGGADCIAVERNLIRGNGGDGLLATATGSLLVAGNAILGTAAAAWC